MSKKSFSELSLVIPVYRGGDLFMDAIRSVERSGIQFDNMIVSFNSNEGEDYRVFQHAYDVGDLTYKYTVFSTETEMNGIDHGKFIVNKLKEMIPHESLIFFLAHDDRIIYQPNCKKIENFYTCLDSSSVYFPSYSCCKVEDYSKLTEVNENEESMTPEVFFWRTQKENVPTSMSGMIVPLAAWEESLEVMTMSGSGARFEHLVAISRKVKQIHFHRCVKTLIASRSDSDAAYLTLLQHRWASIYYLCTFARNGRIDGVLSCMAFIKEFFKKTIALIFAYLNIKL